MKVIPRSKVPPLFPEYHIIIAAQVEANLDELCARVGTKPQLRRCKVCGEENQYKSIYFQLSTGAYASLTQERIRDYAKGMTYVSEDFEITYSHDYKRIYDDNWPNIVDISLQTNAKDIYYDEDLIETVTALGIDLSQVKKFQNNNTWRAFRRKKLKPK